MPPVSNCLFLFTLADASYCATIVGALGIVVAGASVYLTRHTMHQTVIASCAERFQRLVPELADANPVVLLKYLELCNEEIFYVEAGYLPRRVVDEWLDGMLSFIGLWQANQPLAVLPPAAPLAGDLASQLIAYPRLRYAFTVNAAAARRIQSARQLEVADEEAAIAARAQAVVEVLRNLHAYKHQAFQRYLRRARRWSWGRLNP